MSFSRRQFVKGGVTAFTFGFAAPQAICDIAFAQGSAARNLVVVYLSGGNDSLSTIVPYLDPNYTVRRPTIAIPAANVLQIGTDSSGVALGLHPRLTGLKSIFDAGRLAVIQRTGYANQSRSHFTGFDIWGTASTSNTSGTGWLGRYLDSQKMPVDPLIAWNTQRETPRPLMARLVGVPAITNPATYAFSSPNTGAEAGYERTAQTKISSHIPVDRPHLAFVNSQTQAAMNTLDRVATVATYRPANTYPTNGFGQALTAVAGAMNKQIGTKVFWVQTGGFDTHATQGVNQGAYPNLGQAKLTTGATLGHGGSLSLDFGNDGGNCLPNIAEPGWDSTWILSLAQTTDCVTRFGMINSPGYAYTAAPGRGLYIRYDSSVDTNWMYVSNVGGVETATSSGVAVSTSFVKFRIRMTTAGHVLFSINGGAETDVSTAITGSAAPRTMFYTRAAAAKTLYWDFLGVLATTSR